MSRTPETAKRTNDWEERNVDYSTIIESKKSSWDEGSQALARRPHADGSKEELVAWPAGHDTGGRVEQLPLWCQRNETTIKRMLDSPKKQTQNKPITIVRIRNIAIVGVTSTRSH